MMGNLAKQQNVLEEGFTKANKITDDNILYGTNNGNRAHDFGGTKLGEVTHLLASMHQ